jgi:16S rRNA processing protein RimM
VRRHGGQIILKLAGIDGIEAARALVGQLVAVAEADVMPLAAGQFYPWQLEGCRVETEDGARVGEVTGIERGPAQDLWVVSDGPREHLVPAVPEIVIGVDLGARRVVIRPPEGLLDL